jgi:sterol desaturase/sphingolipid hydroxylase (fatty acid hydroxylase superfamily)
MTHSFYLAACIVPSFLFFVGIEYWAALKKGRNDLFSYSGSIVNISVGVAERLLNLFITGSFYTLYIYLFNHFALFSIPSSWLVWVLLLLSTDLIWYWYHRLGHEINLFWGAHIVHHQSEEFNYTVSARITTLQAIVRNLFWCILPLIGFDPSMVITILVIHGTYSFFTHTQMIGQLGWLEYIFITPSHHGVHHAANEKYINKNYGDIFIFWDKLFGTFQKEEEKPFFGLTKPLNRYSFLWQHFHYYFELLEACKRSGSLRKSIQIIFGRPENLDQSIRRDLERGGSLRKKYSDQIFSSEPI